ncbi:MAG: hypothetical protein JSR33_06465 [Proteobacteria bacterium]|nr:hypothetical protein [Pseudomonadota bacterium]
MSILLVALFFFATLIVFAFEWKNFSFSLKVSFWSYAGSYIATTLIGATLIGGLFDKSFPLSILNKFYINTSLLPAQFDSGYWTLAYGSLLIPFWIILFFNRLCSNHTLFKMSWLDQSISIIAFWLVCLPFVLYFSANMYFIWNAGFYKLISHLDYQSSILFRYQLFNQFSPAFYGLAYFALPVFSHVALYQWVTSRSILWGFSFIFLAGLIFLLYIMIVMKGVLLIYLVSLIIGCYTLKIFRSFSFLILILGLVLAIITIYQSLVLGNWHWLDSFILMIFRLSSSFPFFYFLYPKIIPFSGIYIPGITHAPHENTIVFTYMHPSIEWVIGSVTGAAPLMSYTQGGLGFAFFTMFAIGIFIFLISKILKKHHSVFRYTLFIQCLVFLYYLTQISLQAAFISSFGIFWAIFTISLLWGSASLFAAAFKSKVKLPHTPSTTMQN